MAAGAHGGEGGAVGLDAFAKHFTGLAGEYGSFRFEACALVDGACVLKTLFGLESRASDRVASWIG